MPARFVMLGLDACEATLIEHWAGEGHLPVFANLISKTKRFRLTNSLETLPGAIWPEIQTGRSCGKVPLYFHPFQLHTGEARVRPILKEEVDSGDYFWTQASRAGLRVASIDMPQTIPARDFNGLQLFEWGCHDRNFATTSDPPELLQEVRDRYGDHPVQSCDAHSGTAAGYDRILDGVLRGIELKSALLVDVLNREPWDLFAGVYGETHCVGHQFWHFLDPRHPLHDPAAPERFRNAIFDVYRKLDEGVGTLLEAAGPDATVMVLASHGMGLYTGGYQLLAEVLARLGMSSGSDGGMARGVREIKQAIQMLPRSWASHVSHVAKTVGLRRAKEKVGGLQHPLESPNTRAVALMNNRCGAIRLNLHDREPFGRIEPGEEAKSLTEDLRREILALEDPDSGEKIATRVETAEEAFGPDHHPDVPDLLVVFRTDLGLLESCRSEAVGTIHRPVYRPRLPRSGDHTVESRLWLYGPGVSGGGEEGGGDVLDVAPTILEMLDLPVPETIDGRKLDF